MPQLPIRERVENTPEVQGLCREQAERPAIEGLLRELAFVFQAARKVREAILEGREV